MINTFRYGWKIRAKGPAGNDVEALAPPPFVLASHGPFLDVTITHPRETLTRFQREGKVAPSVKVRALIDTGASLSIITPSVAQKVGLVQTGFQKITSVQDQQDQPYISVSLVFNGEKERKFPSPLVL